MSSNLLNKPTVKPVLKYRKYTPFMFAEPKTHRDHNRVHKNQPKNHIHQPSEQASSFSCSFTDIAEKKNMTFPMLPSTLQKYITTKFPQLGNIDFNLLRVFDEKEVYVNLENKNKEDSKGSWHADTSSVRLLLIHYAENAPSTKELRFFRGVVFSEVTKKSEDGETTEVQYNILVRSFEYTEEIVYSDDFVFPQDRFDQEFKDIPFYIAQDGTLLRVFYYSGEWYISTHKRLSAFNSRWSGPKTFGNMFYEAIDKDKLSSLDTNLAYVVLLCHPENRMVCLHDTPKCYLVGTYDTKKETLSAYNKTPYIFHSTCQFTLQDKETLDNFMRSVDWKHNAGILTLDKNQVPIKIINPEYQQKKDIRGNEPNLRIRYYALEQQGREQELIELFPEKKNFFDQIIVDENGVIDRILRIYKYRYEERNFYRVDKETHFLLQKMHEKLQSSKKPRTTLVKIETIRSIIKTHNPRFRNALIRNMKEVKNNGDGL